MADFSKQWCDINDPEMPHDFDIMDEFNKLEPGSYIPYICEGFGFLAIGRDENNKCILAVPTDNEPNGLTVTWTDYNDIIK